MGVKYLKIVNDVIAACAIGYWIRKRVFLPVFGLICLSLFSCSSNRGQGEILTQTVIQQDYVNRVEATGVLEAVKTYTLTVPRLRSDVTVKRLIPDGSYVEPGDTVCVLEAPNIENEYINANKDLENAKADYHKSQASLRLQYLMLESQMNTIDAETQISMLDSTQMRFSTDSRKKLLALQMKRAAIQKESIQSKLVFLKRINDSELKKMEAKIRQQENKVAKAREKLSKLTIKSNIAGLLVHGRLWSTGLKIREGDIVWDHMPIAKVPDLSAMQVKLTVNDTRFKQIEVGQKVQIKIDAFPELQLHGEITKKPPMGKPLQRGSRIKIFDIYSSVDSLKTELQPGLSATCDVIVEEVRDTLTIPLCAVFEKDSSKLVYKQKGSHFVPQPVMIAKNNASYALIKKGISVNDVIALSKPSDSQIEIQKESK